MSSNDTTTGGGNIRELRSRAGLTQVELAEAADCSVAMVRLLEAGHRPKSSAVLARVLAVLQPR